MTIGIGPDGYVAGWELTDGMDVVFGWDGVDGQSRSFEVMAINRPECPSENKFSN
jgi:hypothetical protein